MHIKSYRISVCVNECGEVVSSAIAVRNVERFVSSAIAVRITAQQTMQVQEYFIVSNVSILQGKPDKTCFSGKGSSTLP